MAEGVKKSRNSLEDQGGRFQLVLLALISPTHPPSQPLYKTQGDERFGMTFWVGASETLVHAHPGFRLLSARFFSDWGRLSFEEYLIPGNRCYAIARGAFFEKGECGRCGGGGRAI